MMASMPGSLFALMIFSRSASRFWAQTSMTLTPMSSPYLILRLTYFLITGLSLLRRMSRVGW